MNNISPAETGVERLFECNCVQCRSTDRLYTYQELEQHLLDIYDHAESQQELDEVQILIDDLADMFII